ncbi:hypothetical protein F5B22DRAFT_654770 [Xylaria bambusicola]|uniref:uncharacterized protein n=1 Tax=Xylaria bambusicola TaxID=326684 RepID=UPI0020074573|nr:uncharacterized protein F5B22DRAFT_654770 [Xylaria bambusicola]KAI0517534.1 hypothetical protein F5B22DRAFT_654770 [Xylaria bambusicola]
MADHYWSERPKSPPPSYSASDPAAGSSRDPPPPYRPNPAAAPERNERTPLIRRQPVIVIPRPPRINISVRQAPRINIVIPRPPRINFTTRLRCQDVLTILLQLAAVSFFAYFIWFLATSWYSSFGNPTLHDDLPIYNVAIIGAGPAGIAAAQYLHYSQASRDMRFNITILESKPIVGGMLALHDSSGGPVYPNDDPMQSPITAEDIVGPALMWQNSLFTQDSEKILGDSISFNELDTDFVGFYENKDWIASAVRPYDRSPVTTWGRLIWTYGASVWRAAAFNRHGNLRKRMLEAPVTTEPGEIFSALGVLEPLQQWARELLNKTGISDRYATEILAPQTRRAFGQGLDDLTGFAAMLAASQEDSAHAYTGGHLIERLEHIVRKLGVPVHTSTRVLGLRNDWEGNQWTVRYEMVILAALDFEIRLEDGYGNVRNLSSFQDTGLKKELGDPRDEMFIPVHITFFTTNVKLATWHYHDQALFVDGADGVYEIELVRKTTSYRETQYLYRILSRSSVLNYLKNNYGILWSYETSIANWHPVRIPLFHMPVLKYPPAAGLWWSSAIQQAWSTVDLNWLAGKAIADDLIKEILAGK